MLRLIITSYPKIFNESVHVNRLFGRHHGSMVRGNRIIEEDCVIMYSFSRNPFYISTFPLTFILTKFNVPLKFLLFVYNTG